MPDLYPTPDSFAAQDPLDRLIDAHRRGADQDTIAHLNHDYQHHEARMLRRLDQVLTTYTTWSVRSSHMTQAEADQLLTDAAVGDYPDPPSPGNPLLDPEFRRKHGIEAVGR